jgi:hypothetical protein
MNFDTQCWQIGMQCSKFVHLFANKSTISTCPAIGIPPRFARDVAFCPRLCNKKFTLENKAHNLAA